MAVTTKTDQAIIAELTEHIRKGGGAPHQWYVGIAANARDRLFNGHSVREQNDRWIFRECADDDQARRIEQAFLRAGYTGGDGGGDRQTQFVYAYKIAPHTRQ